MNHPFTYVGCFFNPSELWKKLQPYRHNPLEKTISEPHVTFAYRPNEVDQTLFGTDINVTIIGYGNNGMNEGVKVSINSDNPKLQSMISEIEIPHITISVSEGAEPVNTKDLEFAPVLPIEIRGKYGGFTEWRKVVLQQGDQPI